jgi:hypothetical protein
MATLSKKPGKGNGSSVDAGEGNSQVSGTGPVLENANTSNAEIPLIEATIVSPITMVDASAVAISEIGGDTNGVGNDHGNQRSPALNVKGSPKTEFDIRNYSRRLTNFDVKVGGVKKLSRIPVKKPPRDWWVQAHPEIACEPGLYEDKTDREFYLVDPELYPLFGNKVVDRVLFLCVNSQGLVFWWPVNAGGNGRYNSWNDSALEAVQAARKGWIRIESNMSLGAYDIFLPSGTIPDPEWPQEDMNTLLEKAFKGKIIDNPDHPIVKILEGRLS